MIGPRGAVGKRSVEIETDVRVSAATCVAAGSSGAREGEQTSTVMNINGQHRVVDEASTADLPRFARAYITISAL